MRIRGRIFVAALLAFLVTGFASELEKPLIDNLNELAQQVDAPVRGKDFNAIAQVACSTARIARQSELFPQIRKQFGDVSSDRLRGIEIETFLGFEERLLRKSGASERAIRLVIGKLKQNSGIHEISLNPNESYLSTLERVSCGASSSAPPDQPVNKKEQELAGALIQSALGIVLIFVDASATPEPGAALISGLVLYSVERGTFFLNEGGGTIIKILSKNPD